VVAIGGNSLMRAGEAWDLATERQHVAETCEAIAAMAASGWRLVLTHGNGPQVGAALLRSERADPAAYPLTLDACVASTQGEIGVLLASALDDSLSARGMTSSVTTVLTRVLVAADDPAFADPTKPIGPHVTGDRAESRRRAGWVLVEDPPHGYRRAVPSPEPLAVLEEAAVRLLLEAGRTVVAAGGGGVPVVRHGSRLSGVEAVIDKDLTAALLAVRLGADLLVVLTDVEAIFVDFGTPQARRLGRVDSSELRRHAQAGHFPAGSMGPKVDAILRFVESGAGRALVTSPGRLGQALRGEAGTHVVGGRG
jgi:carbamate kinase